MRVQTRVRKKWTMSDIQTDGYGQKISKSYQELVNKYKASQLRIAKRK